MLCWYYSSFASHIALAAFRPTWDLTRRAGEARSVHRLFTNNERNLVLLFLRDRPEGAESPDLVRALGLPRPAVERCLIYCVDYGLAARSERRIGSCRVSITQWGRGYLALQGF